MDQGAKKPQNDDNLRKRAEEQVAEKNKGVSKTSDDKLHELSVHQIKLEMQNETLIEAQAEMEKSRSRYTDLFDFAPVGYFVLDEQGCISEVNLAGAAILGLERANLLKKRLSTFIARESQDEYYLHRIKVQDTKTKQSCELRLNRKDGDFFVQLDSIAIESTEGKLPYLSISMIDITRRKLAESKLEQYRQYLETMVKERTAELEKANENLKRKIEEHKQAESSLQNSNIRLKFLSDTAEQLLLTDKPQDVVENLCNKVMAHLDCDIFLNFLVNEKAGKLYLNASAGIPKRLQSKSSGWNSARPLADVWPGTALKGFLKIYRRPPIH